MARNQPNLERYLTGRKIPEVAFPLQNCLSIEEVFKNDGKPDLELLRYHFHGEGRLDIACLLKIVRDTTRVLADEENIVHISDTVKVVGAICGQFYDLLTILTKVDLPGGEKCVFLGKYDWDAAFTTETVLYLYAHKLVYPDSVFLLRSQRETRLFTKITLKMECQAKYNLEAYDALNRSFDHLPIVAIVNKTTMCVHGGFSPRALSLADIDKINRFKEPPPRGALTDMLWADPDPNFGQEPASTPCFKFNRERKISVYFTYEAFKNFMNQNSLTCLIRGNQPLFEGFYEYPMRQHERSQSPLSMKAIFSAPNFRGKRNKGAMLILTPTSFCVNKFLWVSTPYFLPNYMDCFTWSLPFLVRKATLFVSDLLELMDRDTAASDVKAALKKHKERSNVLSVQPQAPRTGPSNVLLPSTHLAIFSEESMEVGLEQAEELSFDEEESPPATSAKGFFMTVLCCQGQTEEEP